MVDDQEANVSRLVRLLASAGYSAVSSTCDPREVCELQRRHRYSLILLDLHMPGMNGFEVLEALKEVEQDDYVPVLVFTAQPMHKLGAAGRCKDFISSRSMSLNPGRVRNMLEGACCTRPPARTARPWNPWP